MAPIYKTYYQSPIGIMEIACTYNTILSIKFINNIDSNKDVDSYENPCISRCTACTCECIKQLNEYFKGKRKKFMLDIKPGGTDFQKKVWAALMEIPYGDTSSYGKIAEKIGNKKAARAVGNANKHNPVYIIVPCHRVIGSNGNLSGYGEGEWRKEWLLDHERKNK